LKKLRFYRKISKIKLYILQNFFFIFLVQYTYLIIDDDSANIQDFLSKMESFPEYYCIGTAADKEEGINKILETKPALVFLEIEPGNKKSDLSLQVITGLHQFIDVLPKFVVLATSPRYAFEAIKAGVFDYILRPLNIFELRKTLLKFAKLIPLSAEKSDTVVNSLDALGVEAEIPVISTICIKSYGDYQFIALNEIVYLKADNNTTDFFLENGRKLTAYKTLKHYEANLPFYFLRVHNSYIVNSHFVSRINTGKALVYLNGGEVSISFSKTFKENVDVLISRIAPEYL